MAKISSKLLRRALLASSCALMFPPVQAFAVDSPAIKILLDRAKAQVQSGHMDIAVSTWKQVLVSDPNNMEALHGLATVEAQLGHQTEANQYIQRLQKLGASSAVIGQLQELRSRPADIELLKQAAIAAKSGQYKEAMEIYRKLYDNHPPSGPVALAYYDTEAALPAERAKAIEGLRRLAQQFPADERYSITLGRVLTYDAATRQEGITLLQRYPGEPSAQAALRQATDWNQRSQAASAVATSNPPASAQSRTPTASSSELAAGFRALNSNNLASAEQHFRASLTRESTHGQANAGLGFVGMRQQNFDSAVQQFERARSEGDRDASVTQALETSRFWQTMGRAQTSLDANDTDSALAQYRSAVTMKPDNADALVALGGTLLRANRPQEAIPYLERAVHMDAKSLAAWRTLFLSQSRGNRQADAVKTAELVPADLRGKLEADVEFLGALATDYSSVGQQALSDRILKRALTLVQSDSAGSSSTRQLQYAGLMMSARRFNNAVRSYRAVLAQEPDNADAWRGIVAAEHLAGRDAEALRAFRQMPSTVSSLAQTDTDFLSLLAGIYQSQSQIEAARSTLQRAIRIHSSLALRLQLASVEMAGGDTKYAAELYQQLTEEHPNSKDAWTGYIQALHATGRDREALRQIEQLPEDITSEIESDPNYLQAVASVYTTLGDTRRALTLIDQIDTIYSQQGTEPPAPVQIQEGWLYLRVGANGRLANVIQQLNSDVDLTADQQEEVSHLWTSWAQQRAAQFRQQGKPQDAVLILSTALRAFPSDISLNNTLADVYIEAGDPKRAVILYARQDIAQADKAICASAIRAALAARDRKQTEVWLQTSLDRFGRDAQILQLAAEFEQQRGDSRRAEAYYRAALQASGPPDINEITSQSTSVRTSQIPATEELFRMLSSSGNSRQGLPQRDTNNLDNPESLWPTGRAADTTTRSALTPESDLSLPPSQASSATDSNRHRTNSQTLPVDSSVAGGGNDLPSSSKTPSRARFADRHSSFGSDDAESDTQELRTVPERNTQANNSFPHSSSASKTSSEPLSSFDDDRMPAKPPLATSQKKLWSPHTREEVNTLAAPASLALLEPLPEPRLEPLPPLTGSPVIVRQQPLTPRQDMEQRVEGIQAASSPYLGGRSWVAFHSGQPGFDRLTIFTADVEQSSMVSQAARLSVIVHPTLLQGGTTNSNATFQIGTLPVGAITDAQSSAGIGGELQLRTRSLGASIGYTPHGFLVENVTGRLLVQPNAGPVTFSFDRQPIEDSQLSYAGLRDPGSVSSSYRGNIWGGVIANAASLQINRGDAASGWYMSVGGQYITGQHIRSNTRIDGFAGAYWSVFERPEYGKLTLGMNLFGMHFANNQRLFTYGNGGYFSPGAYLLSNVPLTFEGHYGTRFHYRAAGSIGLQAFQEDAAAFYPLDPGLQAANNNPYLAERTSVGANYNMEGEGSYLMTEHWHVGGFFSIDNSRDYNNSRVGFYLRYVTHPQSLDSVMGPTGLDRRTGLRPLLIP